MNSTAPPRRRPPQNLGEKQHLTALRVGVEHGHADDLGGERPKIELLADFGALGFAAGSSAIFSASPKQIFPAAPLIISSGSAEVSMSKTMVATRE